MRRPFLFIVVLAVSLVALMWGYGAFVAPYSAGGWWRNDGTQHDGGPRNVGRIRPWHDARIWSRRDGAGMEHGWRDLNLSTDNVKNYFDRWLAWQGNPRLKVGDVKEKDADTIVIDIVTKDNSLVQRFVVNRHHGYFQPSED